MAKFLITGCSGFVAQYFIEHVLKTNDNAEIYGIATRNEFSYPSEKFQYQQLNMLNANGLIEFLNSTKPDYIVHLAANSSVGQSWQTPVETFQNNTNIFLNLVESVRKLSLSCRILAVGSSEVYKADTSLPITEADTVEPKNPYAVARLAQEMIAKLYMENYGLDIVMTRSFNHTGPKQDERFVVPSFIKQMLKIVENPNNNSLHVGNIEIERDFLDVRDIVQAYYMLLEQGKKGEIYNVCSGQGKKLKDIIAETAKTLNINVSTRTDPSRLRPNEIMSIVGNSHKIRNELGWSPQYTFTQTIIDMINFL